MWFNFFKPHRHIEYYTSYIRASVAKISTWSLLTLILTLLIKYLCLTVYNPIKENLCHLQNLRELKRASEV